MSLRARLARAEGPLLSTFAIAASFSTYFAMYAFRKPIAAASFEEASVFGGLLGFKTALLLGQLLGYTTSKFLGTRWLPEVTRTQRPQLLVGLILAAELALVAFGLLPRSLGIIALFANGLPLGMVWGLVVRYLEGRRSSDWLLAGLSCSFILASGVVKDIGRLLIRAGITESWMPAATGALFLLPFLLSVYLLDQLPEPNAEDVALRTKRVPMSKAERQAFFRSFAPALLPLLTVYVLLTAFRDFRDNYGLEAFEALGVAGDSAVFTRAELPVAFLVLLALGALSLVKDARRGFYAALGLMTLGLLLLPLSTWALSAGFVGGIAWMILTGIGSYLAYVPYGSILFERLVAFRGVAGTAVFGIYLADALGYAGSALLQIAHDLGSAGTGSAETRLETLQTLAYATGGVGATCMLFAGLWLSKQPRTEP